MIYVHRDWALVPKDILAALEEAAIALEKIKDKKARKKFIQDNSDKWTALRSYNSKSRAGYSDPGSRAGLRLTQSPARPPSRPDLPPAGPRSAAGSPGEPRSGSPSSLTPPVTRTSAGKRVGTPAHRTPHAAAASSTISRRPAPIGMLRANARRNLVAASACPARAAPAVSVGFRAPPVSGNSPPPSAGWPSAAFATSPSPSLPRTGTRYRSSARTAQVRRLTIAEIVPDLRSVTKSAGPSTHVSAHSNECDPSPSPSPGPGISAR